MAGFLLVDRQAPRRATRHPRPALDLAQYRSDQALERRGCVTARPARQRQLAEDLRHRRRLLEQRSVPDREIAADHAAVSVDQAVGDAVHMFPKMSRVRAKAQAAVHPSVDCRSRAGRTPVR